MFRVVNGKDLTDEEYQIFVSKYNNNIKVKDIIKEMDLTYNQYRRLLNMAIENNAVIKRGHNNKKRRGQNTNAKYYYYDKRTKKYVVYNPVTKYVKLFYNEIDAKKYVEKIRKNNWTDTEFNRKNVPYNNPDAFLIEVEIEYNRNDIGYFRVKQSKQRSKDGLYFEYRYRDEFKKYHKLFAITIEDLKEKVLSNNLPWMSKKEMKAYIDKKMKEKSNRIKKAKKDIL